MRTNVVSLVFGLSLLAPASALAQDDLGDEGVLVLGVERLYGLVASTTSLEGDTLGMTTEIDISTTRFTLLGTTEADSPHAMPRLALDYFVAGNISAGLAFSYGTVSGEAETRQEVGMTTVTSTSDTPDLNLLTLHLRAGYLLMFGDMLGLWPKLGFAYFTGTQDTGNGGEDSLDGFALNLDGAVVLALAPHFGLSFAVFADLGLGGNAETELAAGMAVDTDATITDFGLMGGLYGYL